MKPKQSGGIAKVLIPHHSDPEKDLNLTPRQVLDSDCHLLDYNREHFRKAAASPCGHGVIHDALTYSGLSAASDSILQVEIHPSGMLRTLCCARS